ncbi:cysteine desulfurase [Oscillospiraceae bacterium CM]|nr:cysteine desulfurase [Oscillospiraceae bacterium CM]
MPGSGALFNAAAIRNDFPILHKRVGGRPLVWLDNAATTQKPACVIRRLVRFYEEENSNVHRAAHTLAQRATAAYEQARSTIAAFLGAQADEIVFVRGATEGINLVASSYGTARLDPGDEILVSGLEHHANIVPWQFVCRKTGALLREIPIDDGGDIVLSEYARLLTPRVKIVAVAHVSNALGTILPIAEMTALAHQAGAVVLVDGAQAVSHLPVDVRALDCDFYVFSGHKLFGPTGIGVLYGKKALLDAMPPYQGGGNMIESVTLSESRFQSAPQKFEAGTGNLAGAVGLSSAIDYVTGIGLECISQYEQSLLAYMLEETHRTSGVLLVGHPKHRAGVVSFSVPGRDAADIAHALDRAGIAVRAGHHCAQPVLKRFGLDGTVRASLALYNTFEDIDLFIYALRDAVSPSPIFSYDIGYHAANTMFDRT